jgi:indolepyruvate ferredoxin oxidoreductase, beta subunit
MDAEISKTRPISIAICALGGEGGGVLADWIVDLAERGGYLAQSTSVPGVAQRTGATIYYVELFPKAAAQSSGRDPVLALMPVPGDVDIVLASELMEAARAVERGFVTPGRTTLLTSTHRVFAMTEKIALADGRADEAALIAAARGGARRLIAFDMEAIADATRSLVSAVLFGTLAGSGALPFQRAAFEATIRRAGVGVTGSLAAFSAGFEAAASGQGAAVSAAASDSHAARVHDGKLWGEIEQSFPDAARATVLAGAARLLDYQDAGYAREYLARLARLRELERRRGDGSARLLDETARQLALAMSYEDAVRVAELKIRASRFARVSEEVALEDSQILEIAEYFHPRTQEIADILPAPLGHWLLRTGWARALADRLTRKGRVIKTTAVSGFLLLYGLARLKPLRRRSLRFAAERRAIDEWVEQVAAIAETDYPLAVEIARARTLVKGYGDTHARGVARFETLMGALPRVASQGDPAATFRQLLTAALADEAGMALERAISLLATPVAALAGSNSKPLSPHGREVVSKAADRVAR